jgi:hypothetical protein
MRILDMKAKSITGSSPDSFLKWYSKCYFGLATRYTAFSLVIVAALLVLCDIATCAETGGNSEPGKSSRPEELQIDFLEPVNLYDPRRYFLAVRRSLLGDSSANEWMIATPAHGAEYALQIGGVPPGARYQSETANGGIRVLTYLKLKRPLWRPIVSGQPGWQFSTIHEVEIHHIEIPENLVSEIQMAWRGCLRLTRYTGDDPKILPREDATTYYFANDFLMGSTNSLAEGVPHQIVALGEKLRAATQADVNAREELLKDCSVLARKIAELNAEILKRISASGVEAGSEFQYDDDDIFFENQLKKNGASHKK